MTPYCGYRNSHHHAVFKPISAASGCVFGAAGPNDELKKSYANMFTYSNQADFYYGNDLNASSQATVLNELFVEEGVNLILN